MSRDYMLQKVRTALGRAPGEPIPPPPEPLLRLTERDSKDRVALFQRNLEALNGHVYRVQDRDAARERVAEIMNGASAVASNSPLLRDCGIVSLPGIETGFGDRDDLRAACARTAFGITGAECALAETGTLVMFSNAAEARLISLLPPAHIAVIPASLILNGLDDLFSRFPRPADQTSAMVFITGPSRTADIEQILVRGVHGPGELHAVIIEDVT